MRFMRISGISALIVAGLFSYGPMTAFATQTMTVIGDVLNIENGEYILKDVSGHELHFRADQSTEMKDRIKVGDKVEVRATDGHADSMRVKLPDDPALRPASASSLLP